MNKTANDFHHSTRQAVLITAYKNMEQILDIIHFLGKDFEFYIHIDKKSLMDLSKLSDWDHVHVFRKYTVHWGSVNHLKSILFLAKAAVADKRNGFFHLITGQDFPVKPVQYFYEELDTGKDYLDYSEMPIPSWRHNGGMYRMEYYHPHELFDYKTKMGKLILQVLVKIQKIIHRKRKIPYAVFPRLYGGSTYWSLTRDSLQYVLDFTDHHKEALQRMKFTLCPEEIYFQTVLLNSGYAKNIVNDNLRYVNWKHAQNESPAFLDKDDYEAIKRSNKLFARKFHETLSGELKSRLQACGRA
jgi:hypothetical protein